MLQSHATLRLRTFAAALLLLAAAAVRPSAQDPPRFTDKVDVARVLLDVRAIDPRGQPLPGLGPADFEVKIDGKPSRVESAQHVTGLATVADGTGREPAPIAVPNAPQPPPGRLVVFLFQKDLHRSRIPGLMLMLRELQRALDSFTLLDQVAVLRFDSRLQLLQDFSQDRALLRTAFEHGVLFGGPAEPGAATSPSLRPTFDRERTDPSWTMEKALLRIAQALEPLPGPKSVVVVGHGFGRLGTMGVTLEPAYDDAREALQRARASVFCLDVTNADYHSLEAGLQVVADDTGGLYQRTHIFSRPALDRVLAALDGQYVLFVDTPALGRGSHRVSVRLKGRDGQVLAPSVLYVK